MKKKTIFKNRRGVGGLISLVGLVLVFSISSVAYLDLSSTHANLISTTSKINQKILESNSEKLTFNEINAVEDTYKMLIINNGSNAVLLKSVIVYDRVTHERINPASGVVEKIIAPGKERNFTIAVKDTDDTNFDSIFFVTETGKKCRFSGDATSATC